MEIRINLNELIYYLAVLLLSVLFIFVGNRIVSEDTANDHAGEADYFHTGVVTNIFSRGDIPWGDESGGTEITFYVRITSEERRGEIVRAEQRLLYFFAINEREVSIGDRVILYLDPWSETFNFAGYARINRIIVLGVVFLVLVILFGKKKGFNAIVALGFTCMAVFFVFIPAILAGRNIYITTIVICIYAIVSTLLIVIGPNKKALSAMLGCLGGVLFSSLLMFIMDLLLRLTGNVDRDIQFLLHLENPVDIRALIFAGVVLGAVGAIMDVAMSISSSLWELKETGGVSDFRSILKSGITIGKDILGTMLNTLILAYIGSTLWLILLISAHNPVPIMLFNSEMVIVEFLRALVGSFGMLLAIPLTAAICGWFYAATATKETEQPEEYVI